MDANNPKAVAISEQLQQLESEKKQIVERQARTSARLEVIELQLTALQNAESNMGLGEGTAPKFKSFEPPV